MVEEIKNYKCGKCGKIYKIKEAANKCENQTPTPCPFKVGEILVPSSYGEEVGISGTIVIVDLIDVEHTICPKVSDGEKEWILKRDKHNNLDYYFNTLNPAAEIERLKGIQEMKNRILNHKSCRSQ